MNSDFHAGLGQEPGPSPFCTLTLREREVAAYITRGTPNKITAAELGISQRTIEAHRARIFMKLRVRNAVELTQKCLHWQAAATGPATLLAEPVPRGAKVLGFSAPGTPVRAVTTVR